MKTLLFIFLAILISGCGARTTQVQVIQTGPDEFLVFDPNCNGIIRRDEGSKFYYINDEEAMCRTTNVTLGEHLADTYGIEGAFEDGDVVYFISEENMALLLRYMIRNGISHTEE